MLPASLEDENARGRAFLCSGIGRCKELPRKRGTTRPAAGAGTAPTPDPESRIPHPAPPRRTHSTRPAGGGLPNSRFALLRLSRSSLKK
ncbi:rCG34782, isoform CRA_a [Rattus norvegicus]|uniref:RCG34782, isoform CRA_a n=1 Tax=Rattus norvegicus TaxID=10116 RepID=A6HK94_RAT|nr:rCG34782, isoform CRA_a [Rattus norvegicus]